MSLTNKQARFVDEYLQCFNATEAARRAGYAEKYLHTNASKLLQNTTIKGIISERLRASAMSADEVLQRLAEQARGDQSQYVDTRGKLDISSLVGDGKAHLIKKIKETSYGTEYEFYDSQSALALIGKHHALFIERQQQLQVDLTQLTDEQLDRLASGENVYSVLATAREGGTGETATEEKEQAPTVAN